MMEIFNKYKKIIIGGGVVVLIIILVLVFASPKEEVSNLVAEDGTQTGVDPNTPIVQTEESTLEMNQNFKALLLSTENITIDTAIFSRFTFKALKDGTSDFTQIIGSQGRPNPFAPIGNDVFISPFTIIKNDLNEKENTNTLDPLSDTPNIQNTPSIQDTPTDQVMIPAVPTPSTR